MKPVLYITLLLLASQFSLYPLTYNVDLDSTYCQGSVQLVLDYPGSAEPPYQDTVHFSNGLKLFGVMETFDHIHMLTGLRLYFLPGNYSSWGNKQVAEPETLTFDPSYYLDYKPDNFYRNDDYLWDDVVRYPDELVQFEFLSMRPASMDSIEVKALFSTYVYWFEPFTQYETAVLVFERCIHGIKRPQLFYIRGQDGRKFKFKCDLTGRPFYDSVLVSWAADSMGNGIFKNTTSIHNKHRDFKNENNIFPEYKTTNRGILFYSIKPGTKVDIYNLKGVLIKSRTFQTEKSSIEMYCPSGAYIMSVTSPSKKCVAKATIF